MLKKVLKYDLKAIFRIWWIAAAATVVMAVLSGFAGHTLGAFNRIPAILEGTLYLVQFFSFFCIAALPVVAMVLIFIRFYKNFFTDEGYLTFTLPARRETLLNSKLLAGTLTSLASIGVCLLDVIIILCINFYEDIFTPEFIQGVDELFTELCLELGHFLPIYCLELLVIALLLLVMSVVFLCCCITFGSMIVKKGKLLASIGIYYGANSLFVSVAQIFLLFGMGSVVIWWEPLSVLQQKGLVALIGLGVILFLGMLCSLLYAFQHWMLDKKLNLS